MGKSRITYAHPRAKMALRAIFCFREVWSFQTIGIGRMSRAVFNMVLMVASPVRDATRSIQ